jgi:hypothetical protein
MALPEYIRGTNQRRIQADRWQSSQSAPTPEFKTAC